MNAFDKAREVGKARDRVRRLYGMGRLNMVQHNAGMLLINALVRATTDEAYARQIMDNKEVFDGAASE